MNEQFVPQRRSVSLIILCVLTILGNVFLILKGLATYYWLDSTSEDRRPDAILMIDVFFLVELLTCLGSIAGAMIMLTGKKIGLRIYQVSSIVYMVMTFALAVGSFLSIAGIPLGFLQFIYLVPSLLFFLLYASHRKYLH
jgi:hypothetical protein